MAKGILVTTDGKMLIKEYQAPLHKTLGTDVGGYIEIVRPKGLPRGLVFICNEEGLILDLPFNATGSAIYGGPIAGDIIFMAEGMTPEGPDIIGLTDEQTTRLSYLINHII